MREQYSVLRKSRTPSTTNTCSLLSICSICKLTFADPRVIKLIPLSIDVVLGKRHIMTSCKKQCDKNVTPNACSLWKWVFLYLWSSKFDSLCAFIKHTCTNLKEFVLYNKIHNYLNMFNMSWISLKGHLYKTPYWNGHLELVLAFLYSLFLTFYNWWTSL